MDEILPYVFNAFGGLGFTSLMCAMMGGTGLGGVGNTVVGIAGGLGVGAAVQALGLQNLFGPDHTIASYAQDLLEGALGGCVLAMVIELIKGRTHA
ncbi:MAG TPA: hypothetical protein VIA80_14665 [Hyphomonadaceae bacterium]|jgi:uncharacterized membrane protein YeaQ/YmgE (transglycosylase-associated protein family)